MTTAAPLYKKVLDQIRADIQTGKLAIGASLPSEQRLCERFGVSRITIRRAMDELVQDGAIDRGVGRAARVSAPRIVHAITAFEDPFASLRLVRNTSVHLVSFGWEIADAPVSRALHIETGAAVLRFCRVRHLDGKPIYHTDTILPAEFGMLVKRKALNGNTLHDVLAAAGHAPETIDRQIASAPCPRSLAKLLDLAPGAPTFRFERISRSAQGCPLHILIGHWRWDRFSMRLTSTASADGGVLVLDDKPSVADAFAADEEQD